MSIFYAFQRVFDVQLKDQELTLFRRQLEVEISTSIFQRISMFIFFFDVEIDHWVVC